MRETRPSGSVEGVMSNRDPYSDSLEHPLDRDQSSPSRGGLRYGSRETDHWAGHRSRLLNYYDFCAFGNCGDRISGSHHEHRFATAAQEDDPSLPDQAWHRRQLTPELWGAI